MAECCCMNADIKATTCTFHSMKVQISVNATVCVSDSSCLMSKTSLRPVGSPWAVRSKIRLTKESVCPATGDFSGGKEKSRWL